MKKIIATLVLALSVLGGSAALSMPASASTLPHSVLGVGGIVWTTRTAHYAIGHGRETTGQAVGKYTTVAVTHLGADARVTLTIYLNKPYRSVEYWHWDQVESIWRYAGGKCLPKPELDC